MANTTLCGLQYTLHICVWYRYIVYSTLCTLLVYILKIKVSFIYKKNKRLTYHSQTSFLKLTFFIHCCAFCLWWLVTAYDGLTVVFACLQLHVDKRVEQLREKNRCVCMFFCSNNQKHDQWPWSKTAALLYVVKFKSTIWRDHWPTI